MGQFHLVYFTVTGQQVSKHVVDYEQMTAPDAFERAQILAFEEMLAANPSNFKTALPPGNYPLFYQTLGLSAADVSIGLDDDPTMILMGVLASGLNETEDKTAIRKTQKLVASTFHGTEIEPSFDLSQVADRPFAAALVSYDPERKHESRLYDAFFASLACAFFRLRGVI